MRLFALLPLLAMSTACSSSAPSHAAATPGIGDPAPAIQLPGTDGQTRTLAEQRGKVVVLEWFNPGCPFVKYAHGEGGPLANLASTYAEKEVVWWAINSGAPGKQGHGLETNKTAAAEWSMQHPILLDESGAIGRAYGAITTPQMVIVDPEGKQVYNGALDNAPLGKVSGGGEPVSYFTDALDQLLAGQAISLAQTKPYGCSVKYDS